MLREEFLKPLRLSQRALAEKLNIPVQRVNAIVNGKRGITPETAWLFADFFGSTPEFWTTLQSAHDLARGRPAKRVARIAT